MHNLQNNLNKKREGGSKGRLRERRERMVGGRMTTKKNVGKTKAHGNFESPGIQHHDAEKPCHQGDNKKYEREQVHIILGHIVELCSEVGNGGKGQP